MTEYMFLGIMVTNIIIPGINTNKANNDTED